MKNITGEKKKLWASMFVLLLVASSSGRYREKGSINLKPKRETYEQ
jgi:hypothetical protein